jgi:pimeloyl-ACP methyl ester carboxylesterase
MTVAMIGRWVAAVAGALLVLTAWSSVVVTLIVARPVGNWLTRWVDRMVNGAFRLATSRLADYRRRDRILAGQAAAILRALRALHISASGRVFWGSALANIHPGKDDTYVDYHNDARPPLLFISGKQDHLFPPKVGHSNAKHYKSKTVTEIVEFDGPHLLPAIDGWEEVADYALDWALKHAE